MLENWQAVKMTEKTLIIKLKFQDPLKVSAFSEPDQV